MEKKLMILTVRRETALRVAQLQLLWAARCGLATFGFKLYTLLHSLVNIESAVRRLETTMV